MLVIIQKPKVKLANGKMVARKRYSFFALTVMAGARLPDNTTRFQKTSCLLSVPGRPMFMVRAKKCRGQSTGFTQLVPMCHIIWSGSVSRMTRPSCRSEVTHNFIRFLGKFDKACNMDCLLYTSD